MIEPFYEYSMDLPESSTTAELKNLLENFLQVFLMCLLQLSLLTALLKEEAVEKTCEHCACKHATVSHHIVDTPKVCILHHPKLSLRLLIGPCHASEKVQT